MRRLVLFDCDGTLVDSQHDIVAAMSHAFEAHDLVPPTRAQTLSIVGLSVPEAIAMLAPGDLYEPEIVSPDEITLRRVSESSANGSSPAKVRFEKRGGYTVGVSGQPVSLAAIKEALAEFP